jgi:formylglycine-generating enzyme
VDADARTGPGQGRLFPVTSPRVSGSGPFRLPGSVPAAQACLTVPLPAPAWVEVPGGRLPAVRRRPPARIGDLEWLASPVTAALAWLAGMPASGMPACPATGLDREQAAVLAGLLGGRLPASAEWEWMAGGGARRYPWGDAEPTPAHANLRGLGPGRPAAGSRIAGATPDGLLDVAGNVWEWTSTPLPGGGAIVRGGSYNSLALYARCAFVSEIPAATVSPGIGVRVVRDQ